MILNVSIIMMIIIIITTIAAKSANGVYKRANLDKRNYFRELR